ncbi:hypothetical protein ACLQ2R_08295 [Streptosporangium sp. DT93]|uniref:hypothetical protein n=1 Tax=Streptosporangium sp. DT93 TaxID=3393428 RepID=UPI003CF6090E
MVEGIALPEYFRAMAAAAPVAPVELRQADHSEKELKVAAKKLTASAGVTADGPVHAVKMPFDGSGLVAAVDPEESSRASARSLVPEDIGVPVDVVSAPRTKLSSRCDDSPPWYGGVAIRNTKFHTLQCGSTGGAYNCTAGFSVRHGNVTYMLTAGHCGANGDIFTDSMGQTIGTGYLEHTAHDLMLIYAPGGVEGAALMDALHVLSANVLATARFHDSGEKQPEYSCTTRPGSHCGPHRVRRGGEENDGTRRGHPGLLCRPCRGHPVDTQGRCTYRQ